MAGKPSLLELVDHVCAACFGRLVRSALPVGDDRQRWYECTNCGAHAVGNTVDVLCACGFRLKGGRDPGLRCERNRAPSPEFPSMIIAAQQRIEGQK